MSLNDAGSWASIIGFILTVLTFLLAARVDSKVNCILKSKQDKEYFRKRADKTIKNLKEIKMLAEGENRALLFQMNQFSQINDAIELVSASWDILMEYENRFFKKMKISSWKKRFRMVNEMYQNKSLQNVGEMLRFLGAFITFLEKEMSSYERQIGSGN